MIPISRTPPASRFRMFHSSCSNLGVVAVCRFDVEHDEAGIRLDGEA